MLIADKLSVIDSDVLVDPYFDYFVLIPFGKPNWIHKKDRSRADAKVAIPLHKASYSTHHSTAKTTACFQCWTSQKRGKGARYMFCEYSMPEYPVRAQMVAGWLLIEVDELNNIGVVDSGSFAEQIVVISQLFVIARV